MRPDTLTPEELECLAYWSRAIRSLLVDILSALDMSDNASSVC
jgi:hypothetical protein